MCLRALGKSKSGICSGTKFFKLWVFGTTKKKKVMNKQAARPGHLYNDVVCALLYLNETCTIPSASDWLDEDRASSATQFGFWLHQVQIMRVSGL